jgi:hypothetical protein
LGETPDILAVKSIRKNSDQENPIENHYKKRSEASFIRAIVNGFIAIRRKGNVQISRIGMWSEKL